MSHKDYIREAIRLSEENMEEGGGPFGAVIVKDNKVIAKAGNTVTLSNDPTAHAEINAIRKAAQYLNHFDLSGCVIYSSCEPCPMCLGAIYWARVERIYFAAGNADARYAGFDDSFIYEEIQKPFDRRSIQTVQMLRDEAFEILEKWKQKEDKIQY
ncbi:MAG: nucleoside deaminase [Bacteroidota bacterium]